MTDAIIQFGQYLLAFMGWTLALYLIHVLAHVSTGPLGRLHAYHHEQYTMGAYSSTPPLWLIALGLQTKDKREIAEQVVLEILPTLVFCALTGEWWVAALYWADNTLLSHWTDHNPEFRFWWFGHGVFHTDHHEHPNKNYGVYTPLWDILIGTFKKPSPNGLRAELKAG